VLEAKKAWNERDGRPVHDVPLRAPVPSPRCPWRRASVFPFSSTRTKRELPHLAAGRWRRGTERVLVVSSDASVTDESSQLDNGLDIATRFIDVAIGGVTESESQHAERHVESVRLAELDACGEDVDVQTACKSTALAGSKP
jgi:hypothetical protein